MDNPKDRESGVCILQKTQRVMLINGRTYWQGRADQNMSMLARRINIRYV